MIDCARSVSTRLNLLALEAPSIQQPHVQSTAALASSTSAASSVASITSATSTKSASSRPIRGEQHDVRSNAARQRKAPLSRLSSREDSCRITSGSGSDSYTALHRALRETLGAPPNISSLSSSVSYTTATEYGREAGLLRRKRSHDRSAGRVQSRKEMASCLLGADRVSLEREREAFARERQVQQSCGTKIAQHNNVASTGINRGPLEKVVTQASGGVNK